MRAEQTHNPLIASGFPQAITAISKILAVVFLLSLLPSEGSAIATQRQPGTPGDGQVSLAPFALTAGRWRQGQPRLADLAGISASAGSSNVEFVGHLGGNAYAVAVQGNYAYVGEGPRLTILNISNPAAPTMVGKTAPMPDIVQGVAVSGTYAYVADFFGGLRVINIANPASPTQVGFYDTPGYAQGVAVSGAYAYVADGISGLRVINIANSASPAEVGFYNTPGNAQGVAVSGAYAYVADGVSGLRVINIANPANPAEVGFYDTPGYAQGVAVSGAYAYVADDTSGLRVINISNPASPAEVGSYDTPGYAQGVAVSGAYAYVADLNYDLQVINIANPASPAQVGSYYMPGWAWGVAVSGAYAYVAEGGSSLRVINIANPASLAEVGFYDTPGYAQGVAVSGAYAYVADDTSGLRVINISNPASPVEVGSYDTPGWAHGVAVSGAYAYVADRGSGLRVINIANPASPAEVGFYDTPGDAFRVVVSGAYAYVADRGSGLRVINISNPASPAEVGFYDTPGDAFDVAVSGAYAYVADRGSGLRVINISNPGSPAEVGFYDTPGQALGVTVSGAYAYVADDAGGLRIINIADSASPAEVGFYATPEYTQGVGGVAVSGAYAYVADWGGGLRVINISNPTSPTEVGFYATPGSAESVAVSGAYTYVADYDGGLVILRHMKPTVVLVHGWLGFPGATPDVCGSQPVKFIDETSTPSGFGLIPSQLVADGFDVYIAHVESGFLRTPPIAQNAVCLKNQLDYLRGQGIKQFALIAHSMGGLVSRAYLENKALYKSNDVGALFTLGSPHQGAPVEHLVTVVLGPAAGIWSLPTYCVFQPAVCEFSSLGAALFNFKYSRRANSVAYHVISGDTPLNSVHRNAKGMAMGLLIPGTDDGIVPTGSGLTLSNAGDDFQTQENHNIFGPNTYFNHGNDPSSAYTDCLQPVLTGQKSNCGSGSWSMTPDAQGTSDLASHTTIESGTLMPGQITTRSVSLEGGSALFASMWQTGTISVTLRSPSNQWIDPAYAAANPTVVSYMVDSNAAVYYFPNAADAGEWKLMLEAASVPVSGTAYSTFAAFDSSVALAGGADKLWYSPSATANITATLSGSPASAVITATILRADGITDTVPLSSVGAGQYQGAYIVPTAPGYAEVRLFATGTLTGGLAFERGETLLFQISPNSFALSGSYGDTPHPRSPGSYFYQALTVTVGVNSFISGTAGLSADLVDGNGDFVAHSLTIQNMITGTTALALRFDAADLYSSKKNGPYTLTNLLLADQTNATLAVAEANTVYTTTAYDYRKFGPGNLYLPLIRR